jgi:hypothetical protein
MTGGSGHLFVDTCGEFWDSNRRTVALWVICILLGVLAVAVLGTATAVNGTAADGGAGVDGEAAPQSPDDEPNATYVYGEEVLDGFHTVSDVQATPDGGMIALEITAGEPPETTVVRFDDADNVVGQKTVTGNLQAVERVDEDAYVAIGGRGEDVLVVRIGTDGAVEWARTYGGEELDAATGVASAPDGDAYVLASTNSFGAETSDLWVLRVTDDGEVEWERRIEHETWTAFPKGEQLDDGSLIAAIRTKRSMDKEVDGDQNISVVRLTPEGEVAWRTLVSGPGPPADKEEVFGVVRAHGDGVLMVGTSNSGHDRWEPDFWAARVSSGGDLIWQRQYDSETQDLASSVVRTGDGYVLAGASENEEESAAGMLVAIEADGTERFRKVGTYRDELDERFHGMGWARDGRLLVTGTTFNREQQRSQREILALGGEFSQLEPNPSTWRAQRASSGDVADGDDEGAGENADAASTPAGTATLAGDVEPGSADLLLYGAAAVSTGALFLPYGLRRFRRR